MALDNVHLVGQSLRVGAFLKEGVQDQEGWACQKPFPLVLQKKQWLQIFGKITLLRFDGILWKRLVPSSPFDLDTIHTLVVRVWRIGLRVICDVCACFGKHNSRPHLTSHRYPQVKLSGKGSAQLSPAFYKWVSTTRNRVPSPFNMIRC
jgi:hypothetical protein